MRLDRLQVDGFGALRRREFRFGPGLNLLLGPNEAGKSTLQAALAAALYGFYDGCRPPREADALQQRYLPWGGGPYALTLELTLADGRRLAISRDFAERRATRSAVFDAASGRPLGAEYPQGRYGQVGIAETHLGLDAAAFRGCAAVAQAGPALDGSATPLAEALGRVLASAGQESCAGALVRLEEAQRAIGLGPTAKHTPYARLRDQAEALEREQRRVAEARARQAAALERRRELAAELAVGQRRLAALEAEGRRRRLATLRGQIATLRRLEAERHALLAVAAPDALPPAAPALLAEWPAYQARQDDLAALRRAADQAAPEVEAGTARLRALESALAALPRAPAALEQAGMIRALAGELAAAEAAAQTARRAAEAGAAAVAPTPAASAAPAAASAAPSVAGTGFGGPPAVGARVGDPAVNGAPASWSGAAGSPAGAEPLGQEGNAADAMAGAPGQPAPASSNGRADLLLVLFALAGLLAFAALFVRSARPAGAAALALLAYLAAVLAWRAGVARQETGAPAGRPAPELVALRSRLRAAAAEAERRRGDRAAALDAALTVAELPPGPAGVEALEAALAQASRRRDLEANRVQAQADLDRASEPRRSFERALAAKQAEEARLHAALDTFGCPPGPLDDRLASLDERRAAGEAHETRRRRLDDLAERQRLAAPGRTLADLEAEAATLLAAAGPAAPPDAPAAAPAPGERPAAGEPVPAAPGEAALGDAELAAATAEAQRALTVARAEQARLDGVVETALGGLREPATIAEELTRARDGLARLERAHRALDLAREQLLLAQDEVQGDVGPQLAERIGPDFQRLTAGRYARLYVDAAGLRLRVQAPGRPEPIPIEQLSRGAADQALLLLRLAAADLLAPAGETISALLDEPLAHCDPERTALLLVALAQAAHARQILLFTCQPSLEALAAAQSIPYLAIRIDDGAGGAPPA